jgi:hypothetical protein
LTNLSLKAGSETGITYDHIDPRTSAVQGFTLDPRIKHAEVVALLIPVGVSVPGGIEAAVGVLADAYLAVSVFVAGTIALIFLAERGLRSPVVVTLQWPACPDCGL